jgi:hypothetical protein
VVSNSKPTIINTSRIIFKYKVNPSAYEIEKHWGKTAPPPEQLEYLSAKGGGIMTRPENWRHPDHLKDHGDSPGNTPGPLSAARCPSSKDMTNKQLFDKLLPLEISILRRVINIDGVLQIVYRPRHYIRQAITLFQI